MKIEIKTEGRVRIRCFKKNSERENGTLESTEEDQCSSISNGLKARERQREEKATTECWRRAEEEAGDPSGTLAKLGAATGPGFRAVGLA